MARPHRIDYAGAWHHVMNRGAAHRTIFELAADARRFLELVGEGCAITGVRVAAYCLMGNHYHLLVNCPEAGLSEFMQRLSSMYTRYLNGRRGADGPIFRGRFHSLPVDTDEYLVCAGRYIHRNPLDIRPPVALDEFRWSSYQFYVGGETAPEWLTTTALLRGDAADYRRLVEGEADTVPVEWAVDTALIEATAADAIPNQQLRRTLLLAVGTRIGSDVADLVPIANAGTRRSALSRMRSRLANEPGVRQIADRAIALVS